MKKNSYLAAELLEQRFLWKNSNGNAAQVVENEGINDPNIDTKIGNMDVLQDKDKFVSDVDYLLTKEHTEKQRKFDVLGGVENTVGGKEKIKEAVKKKMKKSATHAFGSLLKKIAVIGGGIWLTSKVIGAVRGTIGKIFGFGDKASASVNESKGGTFGSIFKLMMGAGAVFGVYKFINDKVTFLEIGSAYATDGKMGIAKLFGKKIKSEGIEITKDLGIALKGLAKYLGIPLATFGMVDAVKKKADAAKAKLKSEMDKRKIAKKDKYEKNVDVVDGKYYKEINGVRIEVVPMKSKMKVVTASVKTFGEKVKDFAGQYSYSIFFIGMISGAGLSVLETTKNAIGGSLRVSASALASLSKMPLKSFKNFPLASFIGTLAILKFISSLDDGDVMLPKDEKNFDKWFKAKMKDSRVESFLEENGLSVPTNLSDMKDLMYNSGKDVEKKLKIALRDENWIDKPLNAVVDFLGMSDYELIKSSQNDGLKRILNNFDFKENSKLKIKLMELQKNIIARKLISSSDIEQLKSLAVLEKFILEKVGDVFALTQLNENGYEEKGKSINLCVDPSLSKEKQGEISKSFMGIPNRFEAFTRPMLNEARSRIYNAAELLRNNSGFSIVVKSGYAFLVTGAKATVLAPLKVFKSVFDEIAGDEPDWNTHKILTAYGAGIVPVMAFSYGKNLLSPVRNWKKLLFPTHAFLDALNYPYRFARKAFKIGTLDVWPAVKSGKYSELFSHTRSSAKAKVMSEFLAKKKLLPWEWKNHNYLDSLSRKNDVLHELYVAKEKFLKGKHLDKIQLKKIPLIKGNFEKFTEINKIDDYIKTMKNSIKAETFIHENKKNISKIAGLDGYLKKLMENGEFQKVINSLEKNKIIGSGTISKNITVNPKTGKITSSVDLPDGKKLTTEIDTNLAPEKMKKAEKELAEELGKNKNVERKLLSKNIFKSPKAIKLYSNMKKLAGPSFAAWIVYQSLTSKTPQRDIAQDIIMGAGGFATIKLLSSKPGAVLSKKRAILGLLVLTGTILDACGFPYGTNFVNAKLDNFGNYMLEGDKVPLNEFYGGVLNLATSGGMLTRLISKKIAKRIGEKVVKEVVEDGVESAAKRAVFKGLGKRIGKSVAEKIAKVAGKDVLKGIAKRFAAAGASSVVPVAGWIVGAGMALWTAYDAYEIYDIINRGRTINKVLEKRSKKHIKKFKFVEGQSEVERALRSKMLQDGANPEKVSKMSFDVLVETAAAIPGSGNKSLLENIYEGLQSVKVQMIREGDGAGDYEEYHFNAGQIIGVSVSENGEVTKMGGKDFDAKIELPPNLNFDPKRFEKAIDYNEPEEEIVPAIAIFLQIAQAETHWNKMIYKVKSSTEIEFTRTDNGRNRTIRREGNSWHVDGLNRDFTLFQAMAIGNLINYLPKLDDVGEHDAGSKRPFEEDDGALDFDVNWNPNDLEILGANGNAAKFYKKVGLGMGLVADLMNDAYVGGLI